MPLPAAIAGHFHRQADGSATLGSPFTALLCRLVADRLEPKSAFARRIAAWPGNANDDALSLRVAGALNAVARSGRVPALTAAYPPGPTEPEALWAAVELAIAAEDSFLTATLDSPPQTNEVARSNAILGGCLVVAAATGMPLELIEIGASAGLNLGFDRYRYDLGAERWGAAEAPVGIVSGWKGAPPAPLTTPVAIMARAGCDLRPVDPASPDDRARLLSYVWPDQAERVARTEAALALAAKSGPKVERADAAAWIETRLAAAPPAGRVRVVFHTIVWQYLAAPTRARIETAIREAGARATTERPLAWFTMEPDETNGSAALRLTLWPTGETRTLGRTDYHGRWTRWAGT